MDILSDQLSYWYPNSTVSLTNVRWQVIIITPAILVRLCKHFVIYSTYGYWFDIGCDDQTAERSSVFIPINHDDSIDQSDDSLPNSELSTPLVVAKLTLIDVYQEELLLLEESIKATETHEAISVFKQFKNPMVSSKRLW